MKSPRDEVFFTAALSETLEKQTVAESYTRLIPKSTGGRRLDPAELIVTINAIDIHEPASKSSRDMLRGTLRERRT